VRFPGWSIRREARPPFSFKLFSELGELLFQILQFASQFPDLRFQVAIRSDRIGGAASGSFSEITGAPESKWE